MYMHSYFIQLYRGEKLKRQDREKTKVDNQMKTTEEEAFALYFSSHISTGDCMCLYSKY